MSAKAPGALPPTDRPRGIEQGDVVTDTFTGRLLTVVELTYLADSGDYYLTGRFVDDADENEQTRHVEDVEPEGSA